MSLDPDVALTALAIALVLVGPCLGSFASAIAYRVPRGISWIMDDRRGDAARSACPHCGYQLKFLDLIPILSWIMLRGRCRNCGAPVSMLYPALEVTALGASQLLLLEWGLSWQLAVCLLALPFILAQGVMAMSPLSEGRSRLSPQLLAILSMLGVIFAGIEAHGSDDFVTVLLHHLAGAAGFVFFAVIILILRRVMRRSSLAAREGRLFIWLLALPGLWFGVKTLPVFLIVAGLAGLTIAAFRIILKLPRHEDPMLPGYIWSFLAIMAAGQQIVALLIL